MHCMVSRRGVPIYEPSFKLARKHVSKRASRDSGDTTTSLTIRYTMLDGSGTAGNVPRRHVSQTSQEARLPPVKFCPRKHVPKRASEARGQPITASHLHPAYL